MAISQRYDEYLCHFRNTVTLAEFASETHSSSIALRHDVDHDIDIALEMARYEYDRDKRATYFVLHGAPYWDDPHLVDKLLQLQDYNHEVGLHVNVLAEWMRGDIDDPGRRLAELLLPLRKAGLRITGMSAHGDQLCYQASFINYWCFRELRPADPARSENNRTAEGPFAPDSDKRVTYPPEHRLVRADGRHFPLWSVSMHDAGIVYDAWHQPMDGYFSDSGGSWSRSPDPLGADLSRGRHQVLIHPIHWIGSPRTYFFLSAARSGSKWLTQFLDAATPVTARHEYMLNHDFHEGRSPDKATGSDFARLAEDRKHASRLIAEGWTRREEVKTDYAEVNVYLEAFADILRKFYPDAVFVMQRRDPRAVIRSLLSRNWYDTPHDPRHRRVDVADWEACGQFERVCHYVADVDRRLEKASQYIIRLEDVAANLPALVQALETMGIVVHRRLATRVHGEVVNASPKHEFPPFEEWDADKQEAFERICGDIAHRAGYGNSPVIRPAGPVQRLKHTAPPPAPRQVLLNGVPDSSLWRLNGFLLEENRERSPTLRPDPAKQDSHRNCLFGGSQWTKGDAATGWPNKPDSYLAGSIRAKLSADGRATLFVLAYDKSGKQIHRRQLGVLSNSREEIEFACRLRADAARFDVALYSSKDSVPSELVVRKLQIWLEPLAKNYAALA